MRNLQENYFILQWLEIMSKVLPFVANKVVNVSDISSSTHAQSRIKG